MADMPEPVAGEKWVRPSRKYKGSAERWRGETRVVYDRTLGGDVCYRVREAGMLCRRQCTLSEWVEFARDARKVVP